mmetsp:Transcript_45910/g.121384  ORF Transcript_45910/g.121384 Transcript_45910/m.121384 type:complete len:961 (+) Transcript_45910:62-2944(+)
MAFVAAAGLGSMGASLFDYNREFFVWDNKWRFEREMTGLEMRIKQFALYREDVRDLIELTVGRMDMYHLSGALLLGFIADYFSIGRWLVMPQPVFMQYLYNLTAVCAYAFLLLAIWLAMHASVSSHAFGVKLLTRFVRLPLPTAEDLNRARGNVEQFERGGVASWLRLPGMSANWRGHGQHISEQPEAQMGKVSLGDHLLLYQRMQARWLTFDAYCRVCLSVGVNFNIQALAYFLIGHALIESNYRDHTIGAFRAVTTSLLLSSLSMALLRLDVRPSDDASYMQRLMELTAAFLLTFSPLLLCIIQLAGLPGGLLTVKRISGVGHGFDGYIDDYQFFPLAPFPFLAQALWSTALYHVIKPRDVDGIWLPRRFRAVLYQADVFTYHESDMDTQQVEAQQRAPVDLQTIAEQDVPEEERRQFRRELDELMAYDPSNPKPGTEPLRPQQILDKINQKIASRAADYMAVSESVDINALLEDMRVLIEETSMHHMVSRWMSTSVQRALPEDQRNELQMYVQSFQRTQEALYSADGVSFAKPGRQDVSQRMNTADFQREYHSVRFTYNPATKSIKWGENREERLSAVSKAVVKFERRCQEFIMRRQEEFEARNLAASANTTDQLEDLDDADVRQARTILFQLQKRVDWLTDQGVAEIEGDVLNRDGKTLTSKLAWKAVRMVIFGAIITWWVGFFCIFATQYADHASSKFQMKCSDGFEDGPPKNSSSEVSRIQCSARTVVQNANCQTDVCIAADESTCCGATIPKAVQTLQITDSSGEVLEFAESEVAWPSPFFLPANVSCGEKISVIERGGGGTFELVPATGAWKVEYLEHVEFEQPAEGDYVALLDAAHEPMVARAGAGGAVYGTSRIPPPDYVPKYAQATFIDDNVVAVLAELGVLYTRSLTTAELLGVWYLPRQVDWTGACVHSGEMVLVGTRTPQGVSMMPSRAVAAVIRPPWRPDSETDA